MSSQKGKRNLNKRIAELPPIPDKLYFTIGEVGKLCCLRPHVLRYWEQEFSQLSPNKRRGNRRYYQSKDVLLIRTIRSLLYEQGYTIEGARQQLTGEKGKNNPQQKVHHSFQNAVRELEKIIADLEV
ncbi:MAG: transcriptional regulator [Coxiella sp. RIFCSPHIGHO2_12_FULL_44_14]|nr:MAG: transcriptional regulator [Coxiella sp. RIFCSPHIGHO2_12_FULL_44_14]